MEVNFLASVGRETSEVNIRFRYIVTLPKHFDQTINVFVTHKEDTRKINNLIISYNAVNLYFQYEVLFRILKSFQTGVTCCLRVDHFFICMCLQFLTGEHRNFSVSELKTSNCLMEAQLVMKTRYSRLTFNKFLFYFLFYTLI
jgi:hypothetical protein